MQARRDDPVAARYRFLRDACERQRASLAGVSDLRGTVLCVDTTHAGGIAGGRHGDLVAHPDLSGEDGSRDDRADAAQRETPIDGEPESAPRAAAQSTPGRRLRVQKSPQLANALSSDVRNAEYRRLRKRRRSEQGADFTLARVAPCGIAAIDLRQCDRAFADIEQAHDVQMLDGLRHHAVVRSDDEEHEVDAGRAGDHMVDEFLVTRDIDEAEHAAGIERLVRITQLDRDAARLLFLQPIGIDARQRLHERGLAVIDVACGADDHGAKVNRSSWPMKPASSSRQRRSMRNAPSLTRPTTGTGNPRNADSKAAKRPPSPRPGFAGRIAMHALGNVSTGSAPLPIWLAQGSTVTLARAPIAHSIGGRTRSASMRISGSGRVSNRSVVRRSTRRSGAR